MRRSSSKLITRARSVRNVGKVPFKFMFVLLIETVDKIAAAGEIVVVWERSNTKFEATKAAKIDRKSRKASFQNERMSAELTLFKAHPSDRKFQDKVVKLAVRAGSADGKTLAKIHLNLADYAEIPSGSKRISAELSNGSVLIATIQCEFLCMGKATPGKPGMMTDAAEGSADEDEMVDSMGGDAEFINNENSSSGFIKGKLHRPSPLHVRKGFSRLESRSKHDENNSDFANVDVASLEKLRKENHRLRKQVEELEKSGGGGNLGAENRALKHDVAELKSALAREPVYADVVKELKEAKMALALLHMEKEKMGMELMNIRRKASH